MLKNVPIRIISDGKAEKGLTYGSKIIGLELEIFGKRLDFRIAALGDAQACRHRAFRKSNLR